MVIYRYDYSPDLVDFIQSIGIVLRPACVEAIQTSNKLEVIDQTLWEKNSIWTRDFRPVSLLMHSYCRSPLAGKITMGRYSSIGRSVKIMGFQHPYNRITTSPITYERRNSEAWKHLSNLNESVPAGTKQQTVEIGHDCWIGEGVLIKPGLTIGNGSIVGANSVVTKNVEPFEIVAGNPARIVKKTI
jgi:acetyltransferase-like isoleucine patch superfamily enzyme